MESTSVRRFVTRRAFLSLGAGAVAVIAAACSQGAPPQPSTPPASSAPGSASASPSVSASVSASASPAGGGSPSASASAGQFAAGKKLADSVILGRQVTPRTVDPHASTTQSQFLEPRQVYDAMAAFDDKGEKLL